jgi:hypothetical protein
MNAKRGGTVTITCRTTTAGPTTSAAFVLLANLAPTAGALGTNFANLGNFIAMYEVCKIDRYQCRVVPRVATATATTLPPFIVGFVPFAGTAPTTAASFENLLQTKLTPGFSGAGGGVTVYEVHESNCAVLNMVQSDFVIVEAAGQRPGCIATNSLGTQTSFGTIYYASMIAATAVTFDIQQEIQMTFYDLFDPTALLAHMKEVQLLRPEPETPGKVLALDSPTPEPALASVAPSLTTGSNAGLFSDAELDRLRSMLQAQRPV